MISLKAVTSLNERGDQVCVRFQRRDGRKQPTVLVYSFGCLRVCIDAGAIGRVPALGCAVSYSTLYRTSILLQYSMTMYGHRTGEYHARRRDRDDKNWGLGIVAVAIPPMQALVRRFAFRRIPSTSPGTTAGQASSHSKRSMISMVLFLVSAFSCNRS